ncbi:CP2 transcription factor-domain-containing protein, partial [Phycomyces blakesleeanus]
QKTEESPVTYLNRGQAYAIQLNDRQGFDGIITSTLVIMFHDPSHRKVALNYWKFWVSQQKCSDEARAIDIDVKQSSGVHNVQYPSFDKITFDWNGCEGAKIFARFNCLSTDFSRIKGVKGIPLRAHMESQVFWPEVDLNSPSTMLWAGTFTDLSSQFPTEDEPIKSFGSYNYIERSFSKIKLFRDKVTEGDLQNNPMWLMYNHPMPYSIFGEIPTSPSLDSFRHAANDDQRHSGGMFNSISNSNNNNNNSSSSSSSSSSRSYRNSQLRSHNRTMTAPSSLFHKTFTPPPPTTFALRPFSSISQSMMMTPLSNIPTGCEKLERIRLESLTVEELTIKLCSLLVLHTDRVSDVLWRRSKVPSGDIQSRTDKANKHKSDTILVLVEDAVVAQHILENSVIVVEWEIKADSTVRIILQF